MAIYGVIGTMSIMYKDHIDPEVAFKLLATSEAGEYVMAWENPIWTNNGVVTPSESKKGPGLTTRNSFQSRRAAVWLLRELMGIADDEEE